MPLNKNEKLNKPKKKKFGNNVSSSTDNESSETLTIVADSQTVNSSSLPHYPYLP
jgi:hypothetical protein